MTCRRGRRYFDPVTEKIEAISGGERYGACFDDWGNRFLCNIRNPVQHVVLPLHYMQRNPNLIVPLTPVSTSIQSDARLALGIPIRS